jgi:argininosuccinate lyase
MPQKKNSDVAELARGRAGTAIGDLVGLLAIVKGLPLAYNRDLQEDKRPLLGAPRMLVETLDALSGAVETASFHPGRMRAALEGGESLATDAAEWLVERGVPFREAHEAVGKAAAFASAAGRPLSGLTVAEWRRFHPRFDRGVVRCFDPERSLARRDLPGGPAPRRVAGELRRWEKVLGKAR